MALLLASSWALFGQEANRATGRGQETPGGAALLCTLKSDELCEQLAIFWSGSEQSHQERPGDARRSDAFVHSKKRRSVPAVAHFFGQEANRATGRGQETPGGAALLCTLKSDDLCEQLAIFWQGSAQSHQGAPGEAHDTREDPRHQGRRTTQGKTHEGATGWAAKSDDSFAN